ncbi:MAG: hypothetical protein Q4F95_11035 [Oscillospiraceae bacterium]|nr:hypothetical protein [Oscillospiraceae bacterium]
MNLLSYSTQIKNNMCLCRSGWIFRRVTAINLSDLRYVKIISVLTFRICVLNAESAKMIVFFADKDFAEYISGRVVSW